MTKDAKKVKIVEKGGSAGWIWCMGFIGSAIHFVSNTEGFWNVIWAILKALVWPAYLVNKVFELLRIS